MIQQFETNYEYRWFVQVCSINLLSISIDNSLLFIKHI